MVSKRNRGFRSYTLIWGFPGSISFDPWLGVLLRRGLWRWRVLRLVVQFSVVELGVPVVNGTLLSQHAAFLVPGTWKRCSYCVGMSFRLLMCWANHFKCRCSAAIRIHKPSYESDKKILVSTISQIRTV